MGFNSGFKGLTSDFPKLRSIQTIPYYLKSISETI